MLIKSLFFLFTVVLMTACGNAQKTSSDAETVVLRPETRTSVPAFQADSAYAYIEKQVAFGPRVPNTPGHRACGDFLAGELKRHGAQVYVQEMKLTAYDGSLLEAQNIIGSFAPEKEKRILLFAHWDTRPYADSEPVPADQRKPIPGADDGGSGVGVLLEIARQLAVQAPRAGIDIIFFDAEDYGTPDFYTGEAPSDSYCLGSQFWAKNPHRAGYRADFGILLDMVGGKNAVFFKEATSMRYAPAVVERVWDTARDLGYGKFFIRARGGGIIDDHEYVIRGRGIPCIDIIHYDPDTENGFPSYWHTLHDDMSQIDRKTLQAVGQTLLEVIYRYGN